MNRVFVFMVDHQTTTRVLAVALPFMVVWAFVSVLFRWAPGILDTTKELFTDHRWEFIGVMVVPGAIMALYTTVAGGLYLWRMSGTIYEKEE